MTQLSASRSGAPGEEPPVTAQQSAMRRAETHISNIQRISSSQNNRKKLLHSREHRHLHQGRLPRQ